MATKAGSDVPALAAIGLDIGKNVFHLVGLSADGTIAFRRKIKRLALADIFKKLPPCLVGMEACLSAHFVSRTLRALGHEPRIIPAIYVKPFVKGQKNDYNDAEAVAEAALRPNLRRMLPTNRDLLARAWARQGPRRRGSQNRPLGSHRGHRPDSADTRRSGLP